MIYITSELTHFGVKGMKWGIKNKTGKLNKERSYSHKIKDGKLRVSQLKNKLANTKVADGTKVTGISNHAIERMLSRKVNTSKIIDSLVKPLYISPTRKSNDGSSKQYIGEKATSAVNPDKQVITTLWPTDHRRANKYRRKGGK